MKDTQSPTDGRTPTANTSPAADGVSASTERSVAKIIDDLLADGTFEASSNGLTTSQTFQAAVADRREQIATGDLPESLPERLHTADVDPKLLATYDALRQRLPAVSPTQVVVLAVLLTSAGRDRPPSSGAPEGFFPVHGDELDRLVTLCERCVVYVWRDDCAPCDQIRPNLADVFGEEPPDGVLALSVYGPDCATRLQRTFDVVGAPTTLFTLDGSVDARFVGVADESAFERELDTLRNRTPTP